MSDTPALVADARLEALVCRGVATSAETHDMAVELLNYRKATRPAPSASQGAEVERLDFEERQNVPQGDGLHETMRAILMVVNQATKHRGNAGKEGLFLEAIGIRARRALAAHPAPDTDKRAAEDDQAIREARQDAMDECLRALSYAGVCNGCDVLRARMGAMLPADRRAAREASKAEEGRG